MSIKKVNGTLRSRIYSSLCTVRGRHLSAKKHPFANAPPDRCAIYERRTKLSGFLLQAGSVQSGGTFLIGQRGKILILFSNTFFITEK